jgi:MOSC domain-containing protein YiiM
MTGRGSRVIGVAFRRGHHFSKRSAISIRLVAHLGVQGDGHYGATVQHVVRKKKDPNLPNLRQVHLLQAELFDELAGAFGPLGVGDLGENILTRDIDLLSLPTGARLHVGAQAIVELTGLRNPCIQIDRFRPGLMAATLARDADGNLVRKAGVMAIVIAGGDVQPGDTIRVELPPGPLRKLEPV